MRIRLTFPYLSFKMAENVLKLLCSSLKLERDKGLLELQRYLVGRDQTAVEDLENTFSKLLDELATPWETKHGGLSGAKTLLLHDGNPCSDEFAASVKAHALRLLEDGEFRVRIAAGEVMGALCRRNGPQIYTLAKERVLEGVRDNLERQPLSDFGNAEQLDTKQLMEKLSSSPRSLSERRSSTDAAQIFHDTAGWKNLETWMKCLQAMVYGCGSDFNDYMDQELLDLIFSALTHTNRFVRETGYYVCAALVSCGISEDAMEQEEVDVCINEDSAVYQHGVQFSEHLGRGLADNWSQVRLAASVATRKFLLSLGCEEARSKFYAILLPRMCLNRYYVAEGVRIYSQDTWRQVTGGEGKHLVERHIKDVVEYYTEQTEADNHAVREAGCACIAELGSKIDRDAVRPYVPTLLDALLVCFKDDSWPVRDASCVACGNFIRCFPEESRSSMDSLYPLFFQNLEDNIPSVRQGAAVALGNVIRAYGEEALTLVLTKVKEGLEGVEKQPENAEKYSGLEKGPATYGVVKRARDNDMDLHSNQTMYSCGSLAPKMGRGKRGGGCMDHQFKRPSEPWELSEGCVHLVSEMANLGNLSQQVGELLPLMAKAIHYQHYTQHVVLLETVCKQLPNIARGIGKRPFKMHIESFFDGIFFGLTCDNALTSSAASQCLNQLSALLGAGILRGRVEQYNPKYLQTLDANQYVAAL